MFRMKVICRGEALTFELGEGTHLLGSGDACSARVEGLPERLMEIKIGSGLAVFRAAEGVSLEHNGKPAREGKLSAGDSIEWGGFTFFFEAPAPAGDATMYIETGTVEQQGEDGATVALGDTALPAGVISFLADKLRALRREKDPGEVAAMAKRFDEAPPVSRAVLLAMQAGLSERFSASGEPLPREEELKALLLVEPEARTRVTRSLGAPTPGPDDATRVLDSASGRKTTDKTRTMERLIEKEVSRTRAAMPSTAGDKTHTLVKVLENLGVVEEEIKSRALELSEKVEGLTTAEILVSLGVLSEEDIDIKPSKQLAGTHPQLEGKILGDYRLVKELGAGGFGVVYKGESLLDGKTYAIKVLFREYSDDITQLAIFAREAKTAKQFDHPNILKVYGLERFRDTYYMVTEFVSGGDLYDILKEKERLDWRELARYAIPVCRGLHYAAFPPGNLRGIIHRDIKPQNILVTKEGTPKIADFGLAKFEEGSEETQVYQTTNAMVFKGTVSYAAPERFQGNTDIDHRSDIYSLGVMFYEMATGRLPFQGRDISELILAHINEKPIPPRMLNPEIPTALENIILKCLQKRPEQRYRTAGEIADELERLLEMGEKSRSFSIAEAVRSMKLAGTVAIPKELPKGLPLSLRLRYFLMRPRPMFWKMAGAAVLLAVLAAAAAVFVPQAIRARKISRAGALLSAWDYEGAKRLLEEVLADNPGDEEAKKLLASATKRLTRLKMEILPRLREEKSKAAPDAEKLYQLAAEAFALKPTDGDIARDYVEAALQAAGMRIERGEFLAAAEVLDSVRDRLSSALGDEAAPLLASVDSFSKEKDPETLRARFEKLRLSAFEQEDVLKNPVGVVVEENGKEEVAKGKTAELLNAVGLIRAAYERMLEIAPRNLEALMGKNFYSRIFEGLKAAIEADRSGVEARLPRLLAMMRIEPEIREKGLAALAAVYRVWKDQTPFEEIIQAADGFISPDGGAGNRLALQLCQIVLSIAPDEKGAVAVLHRLVSVLVGIASRSGKPADFALARAAVETELRYRTPGAADSVSSLTSALLAAMKAASGSPAFVPLLNHLRALCAAAGNDEPAEAFALLKDHYLALVAAKRFDRALAETDALLSDPHLAAGAADFASALRDALERAVPGAEDEAAAFGKAFVEKVNASDTEGAKRLKDSLAVLGKLLSGLDEFRKAAALLTGEPDEAKVKKALEMLDALSGAGFSHPSLDALRARCRGMLKDFDRYRQARAKRAQAFSALGGGDAGKAAALLDEAAKLDPVPASAAFERKAAEAVRAAIAAREAFDRKDYAAALEAAGRASAALKALSGPAPEEKAALDKLAGTLDALVARAGDELAKLEAERKKRAEAERLMKEGDDLLAKGDYAGALEKFEQARKTWSLPGIEDRIRKCREGAGYKNLVEQARKAFEAGDYDKAAAALAQAAAMRDTSEVRRLMEKVRRMKAFASAYAAGRKAFEAGDYDKAVREFAVALQNAPQEKRKELKALLASAHVGAENAAGERAFRAGNYREAREAFKRSLGWGDSATARIGLAASLLEITALPDVKEEELVDPRTGRSRIEEALDDIRRFRELYSALDKRNAKKLEGWLRLADRYEALALYYKYLAFHDGRLLDRALALMDRLIASAPDNVSFMIDKAAILAGLRRFQECRDILLAALEKDPGNALVHRHLGAALMAMGKLDEAEARFRKAADMNPSDPYAWLGLGNIYKAKGDLARAEKVILRALEAAPNLPEANNNLAWLYATAKDPAFRKPALALKYARRANELTAYRNPDWLDTLAHAYAANGNFRLAVETEKKALELAPDREDLKAALERFRKQAGGK